MAPPESFQDDARDHLLSVDDDGDRGEVKFEVRDLVKESPAGEIILDKVNVDIPRAKIVGIIGPSGSGKSTFLRALNRLWEPPEASVFLDGQDISHMDVLSLRRRVGMLFQLPSLFEGTVADNVRYGPQLRGKKLSDDEVYKYLSLADLEPSFYNKNHNELSIGQAQRVALARTLANEPELKNTCGMTVIMVSHSIKQIQRIANVVCLLVNGAVVEVLKPNQLSEAKHPMALRFLELSS
ncbi:hypothetical protein V2J09_022836 [Rumex salicifolius]